MLLSSDVPTVPYPYAEQLAGPVGLGLADYWCAPSCTTTPPFCSVCPDLPPAGVT